MDKIKRHFFIAGIFLFLYYPIFTQTQEEILTSYYEFENAVFEQILTETEIDTLYRQLVPRLHLIEPPEKSLFFLARAEFFRGVVCARDFMIEYGRAVLAAPIDKPPKLKIPEELKTEMSAYFDTALEFCDRSLEVKITADALLGKSMLVVSRGGLAGGFSALVSIFKFLDLNKLAVKTDPENFEAALMSSVTRAFPPPPFGNPKKGAEEIRVLLAKTSPSTPKMDLFICYVSLASAYANLDQKENALFWLRQAQSVYLHNTSLKSFERKLLEKQ